MELYNSYMSINNMTNVQNQIIHRIKRITNIKIPFQKEESLYIMMRYTFSNFSMNGTDINKEVEYLNDKCLELVVPNIMNSMEQYIRYLKSIDDTKHNENLLDYPKQSNSKEINKMFDYSVSFNKSVDSFLS